MFYHWHHYCLALSCLVGNTMFCPHYDPVCSCVNALKPRYHPVYLSCLKSMHPATTCHSLACKFAALTIIKRLPFAAQKSAIAYCRDHSMCHAAMGTVIVGWSTGNGTIAPNLQAPYYPNATLYAPQTPDPASYNSTVCFTLVHMHAVLHHIA